LDYNKAIEIEPKSIDPKCGIRLYFNRGISHTDKGEYDLAISDFSKAIAINPKNGEGYYNRGRSYYFRKEYEKSWDDIKRAQFFDYKVPPKFLDDLRRASGRQN
jgi:tetratricopeptide (TPR) repeat protein